MPVRDKQRAQVSLQLQLHPQQMLSGAETNWCGRGHCAAAIVDQLPMPLRSAGLRAVGVARLEGKHQPAADAAGCCASQQNVGGGFVCASVDAQRPRREINGDALVCA